MPARNAKPAPAKPPTDQALFNARAIANAVGFTAYVRLGMHPQTLRHVERHGAGCLALIMHRDCSEQGTTSLPCLYAIDAHGGPGTLVPLQDWLPDTVAKIQAGKPGWQPHPAIAHELALIEKRAGHYRETMPDAPADDRRFF